MKTKYIIIILIIVLGACKESNKNKSLKDLLTLSYLLNGDHYTTLKVVGNNQTTTRSISTQQDKDGDEYIEKYATPEMSDVYLYAILAWEENEEPTWENADILGEYLDLGISRNSKVLEVNGDPTKIKINLPYNKKYKKIGIHGLTIGYKFREDQFKDKNYTLMHISYAEKDGFNSENFYFPVKLKIKYIPSGYTKIYYSDEHKPYMMPVIYGHHCLPPGGPYLYSLNSAIPEYSDISKYSVFIEDTPNYHNYINMYCDGEYYKYEFAKDAEIYGNGKYYNYKYAMNDFNKQFEDGFYIIYASPLNPNTRTNELLAYHNANPHTTRLYELLYPEYHEQTHIIGGIDISPMFGASLDYLLENFEMKTYSFLDENGTLRLSDDVFFVTSDIENKEQLEEGNLMITIDVSDVFMWETEHPEWDYFDVINDAPKPSLGKEIKVFYPRIKIEVVK